MPRASGRHLSQEISVEIDNEFINLISTLRSSHEIQEFLTNFLTPEEKIMLSKRLMLHIMLDKRYKTSQIEKVLLVSRDTIRNHKKSWITGGITYKNVLKKLIGKVNTKKVMNQVDSKIQFLKLSQKSNKNMREKIKIFQ